MIKKLYWISSITLILLSCSAEKDQEKAVAQDDFEIFCEQFTQLAESADFSQLTSEERATRLESQLASHLAPTTNAYIAWTAIRNGPASERYFLYKDAALSTGQKNWDCPAVKLHGLNVGSSND